MNLIRAAAWARPAPTGPSLLDALAAGLVALSMLTLVSGRSEVTLAAKRAEFGAFTGTVGRLVSPGVPPLSSSSLP